jgi:hypothetical protein
MKYTIKKGRHYATFTINRLFPFSSRSKEGSIKFSKECLEEGDISGWNKLTGIASAEIHKNSGRLVWRSNGNSIMISGYVYMNGVRREMLITSIDVDKWYDFSIEYSNKVWRFSVNGRQILMSGYLPSNVLNFKCFPYFGGQSVAPQTMYVWVK